MTVGGAEDAAVQRIRARGTSEARDNDGGRPEPSAGFGVVFVHGINSSTKMWDPFAGLIEQDGDLRHLHVLRFGYATGLRQWHPLRVIPSLDTVADSLKEFLATEAAPFARLMLVGHSQGGLVIQRCLVRMLVEGRGRELQRVEQVLLLACPNTGSQLALSLRRGLLRGNPQEQALRPYDEQLAYTRRMLMDRVVYAREANDHSCPIPFSVYAGESDGVVTAASAQDVFKLAGALPGDHFTIARPTSHAHRTYTTFKRLALRAAMDRRVSAQAIGTAGQLRDISTFTGREVDLSRLVSALDEETGGGMLAIHAVDGMPGVGKSAFAVHAAHRLSQRFPDGQVHLHLHAHTPGMTPLSPSAALASLLLGDGLDPRQLPEDTEARAHLWRVRTAGRRMLLLLDDAADAAQVRPMLPSAPGTLVLITSRNRLSGLDDVKSLSLGVLPPADATALLARIAHRPDLTGDDPDVVALVELCGYLPLAIAMLAAQFRRPGETPRTLVGRLREADNRLGELRDQDRTVAAAFDLSYRDLTHDQQRLFRLIGARPGAETDAPAAAALLDGDVASARHLLQDLESRRLVDELTTAPGRYRMHDLLREHAAALAAGTPGEAQAAIGRLLAYYQDTADPRRVAQQPPGDRNRTMAWLRLERENLLASHRYALRNDHDALVIGLSTALTTLLRTEGPWADALHVHGVAAEAARRLGDRHAQADALCRLGAMRRLTGDYPAATEVLGRALEIYRELGDRYGQANTLHELGPVRRQTGRYPAAIEVLGRALEIYRELGDRYGQASTLHELGAVLRLTERFTEAADAQQQALEIYRQIGDRLGEANALHEIGSVWLTTGDCPAAADALTRALQTHLQIGYRLGQGNDLFKLGVVHRLVGDYPDAAEMQHRAQEVYRELGDRLGQANTLYELAGVCQLTGDYPGAIDALRQAQEVYRELGDLLGQGNTLFGQGAVLRLSERFTEAADAQQQALEIYHQIGDRLGEANTLHEIGALHRQVGDHPGAIEILGRALDMHREIGDRQGQVEALNHYGATLLAIGDPAAARSRYTEALDLAREIRSALDEADALEGLGTVFLGQTRIEEGISHLRRALEIYQRLQAPGAAHVARRLAALDPGGADSPADSEPAG